MVPFVRTLGEANQVMTCWKEMAETRHDGLR